MIEPRDIDAASDADERARGAVRSFSRLGQRLASATTRETVIDGVIETLRDRYPRCGCAVRVIDPQSGQLTAAVAHGALLAVARERIVVPRGSLGRAGLAESLLPPGVHVADAVQPIFAGSEQSFCVPIVIGRQLLGVVNVECGRSETLDAVEEELLYALAAQTASALRGTELIFELSGIRIYLEEVIERANALVLVVDSQRRIQVFNQALSRLTGFAREEMIGRPFNELVSENNRISIARAVAQSLRGKNVDNLRLSLRTKHGQVRLVAANTAPLLSPEGEVRGVIAIGQDVTRAEQLESELQQAEKLASFGRLVAGVVHELNNPLTAVMLNAELLRQELAMNPAVASPQRDKLASIEAASQRMLRFTRELLDYARPAADEPRSVPVGDLFQTAVEFCEHQIKQVGAIVKVDLPEGLPPVLGVRSHLQQVVVNLLTNACDALSGPCLVELSAEVRGGEIWFHVRDEGAGIPAEILGRVFEPFVSTKPSGRGTGLGLSIVQRIVHKHGGRVSVRSVLGKGTTFTVVLPAAPQAA
jgi:PAS domain S-box-containing protein